MDVKDLIEKPVTEKPSKAQTSKAAAPVHHHPLTDHVVRYSAQCQACQAEDEERRGKGVYRDTLKTTVFYVPNFSPEQDFCTTYLARTYGSSCVSVNTLNWLKLLAMPDANIVVVRRKAAPGTDLMVPWEDRLGPNGNVLSSRPMQPSKLIHEVLESAPVRVGDYLADVNSISEGLDSVKVTPLQEVLQDIAGPNYRILIANIYDVRSDTKIVFTCS